MEPNDNDTTRAEQARKESPFLTTVEAATYVGLSRRTLEKMRTTGNGPAYRKHGRYVRYHVADLDSWSAARRTSSTSEYGHAQPTRRKHPSPKANAPGSDQGKETPRKRTKPVPPMRNPQQRRVPFLAASLLAVLGLGLPILTKPVPRLVYNASASAPLGFYRLVAADRLDRGDLVLAHLPESAARLAADRHYLPLSVPVLKRIAGLAGDLVCADSGIVVVNDHVAAGTLLIDREGRPLPAWTGCRTLTHDEVFLLMADVPASFDGRYFGPVPVASVIGRLVPLWTW
jgi:conjugative transfer signal peptidase TraF